MRWWSWCVFVAGLGVSACSPAPPPPARAVVPAPAPARPTAADARWPDVARDAWSEKSGTQDAAVVVAVERHQDLPNLAGVRVSAEDWARFFPNVLGVPRDRVTTLFDAAATRGAISSALRAAAARVAPGGRLWFVAVGYATINEADVASAAAIAGGQVISVFDVVAGNAAPLAVDAPVPTPPGALPPITFSLASSMPLPGASRPALSYLLMGALRGWGDRDHDGRVTASEVAVYLDLTLRLLAPRDSPARKVGVNTGLVCSELTTLSVAREPAPNVLQIALRVPPGPPEPTRQLYSRAEEENDPILARCTWSAAAQEYAQSWWSDPQHSWQVEAALNGAYAFRRLGRTDDAAALYRSYLEQQAGATAGESKSAVKERRSYAFVACSSYLALAKAEPRFFPGYFHTCRDVSCTGIDPSVCADSKAAAEVPRLDPLSGEPERARQLGLAARDSEELAGWESNETARADRLREAAQRYAAAEAVWAALVARGDPTPDPAEAARRLAEAAVRRVGLELDAGAEVTAQSIERARKLARRARDLSSDERRDEPARLLVELADELLAREQRAFASSAGERGVAPRSEVRIEGEGDRRHFVRDEIPGPVAAAIAARDEYLARVPATFDAGQIRYRMAYEAGRLLFLYGHFDEARSRLELPYTMACGLGPAAHDAWVLLLSIATLELDMTRVTALASDAAICPTDAETRIRAERMRKPVRSIPFVLEGRRRLQASEAVADEPERRALRREAAAIFRHFVVESPARDEAPESARLAAELYAELHEDARAVEMYRLFLDNYGTQARIPIADLEKAYAALAALHARLGDYRAEARVLVEESEQKRLSAKTRSAAAHKARELRKDRDGRGLNVQRRHAVE